MKATTIALLALVGGLILFVVWKMTRPKQQSSGGVLGTLNSTVGQVGGVASGVVGTAGGVLNSTVNAAGSVAGTALGYGVSATKEAGHILTFGIL